MQSNYGNKLNISTKRKCREWKNTTVGTEGLKVNSVKCTKL